jgi:nitrite reductase (NADH) small subunit
MPNIIKLTTQSELPAVDEAKEFPCGDRTICVANVNGTYSAIDNVCLHRGGPLGEGTENRRSRAQCEHEGRRVSA